MSSRSPEPPGPALAALGTLLDRSLSQIADAARDARTFDRETIRAVSDVWDNTTYPLFWAATGPSTWSRERRARAALEWMARLRPTRRQWMVEQAAVAGHRIDTLIRSAPELRNTPYRDYRGVVRPVYFRWTPEALADLAADYVLDEATVRHLDLERTGTRLSGFLILDLVRSYDPGENASAPCALHVHLDGVTEADIDTGAPPGARLESTPGGVVIGLGAHGVLRAREASIRLDDGCWHLSDAGRRADAQVPPRQDKARRPDPPKVGELEGSVQGAAFFVLWSMLRIRSVRFPREVAHVPVQAYCRALQGAGGDILAAGALPRQQREAAFRTLVTVWLRRGGPDLVPDWGVLLKGVPDARELARGAREDLIKEGAAPPAPAPDRRVTDGLERAGLRMVSYTAAHTERGSRREASTMAHLAVPAEDAGAPWRMRVLRADDPFRLRVRAAAFDGFGGVRIDKDEDGRETLMVGDGDLALDARAWSEEPGR
ncbi:hypothetical protein AB0I72_17660 [Nocardiopsis sp. NPDC049922]|uniref:hypothetical protein n=1 Tax=Nocardiopsis sp. NPDC049922 TaxID=3155157 RepID=UPI0033ED68E0